MAGGTTMMMQILMNHEQDKVAGRIEATPTSLLVTFPTMITKDAFFDIFGNCGARFTDQELIDDVFYVKQAEILEWSISPTHTSTSTTVPSGND
jgi:hypothetical protein